MPHTHHLVLFGWRVGDKLCVCLLTRENWTKSRIEGVWSVCGLCTDFVSLKVFVALRFGVLVQKKRKKHSSYPTHRKAPRGGQFVSCSFHMLIVFIMFLVDWSVPQFAAMEATLNNTDIGSDLNPSVVYRCKKCRRIVATEEHIVSHERGGGQKCFKWKKRNVDEAVQALECSSIFVEPMKWMQALEEGCVGDKLQCIGCNARLGSFNWAGMQCNCGAWINPAFQLHKSRMDKCRT